MFDFIPIVSDKMVLASMSDPDMYLGGDEWLLVRPFRKETWLMVLITTTLTIAAIKFISFQRKFIKNEGFRFSKNARNIVYLTVSFFFVIILAYYEGALIMFFSSDKDEIFNDIKDAMNLYPRRKLMMREGYDIYYQHYVESGDKDYVEFWNRVKHQPRDTVFSNVDDVFERFPEGGVIIHELEGAIQSRLHHCGSKQNDHFDAYVRGRSEHHNLIVTKNSPLGPILRYGSRLLLERGLLPDYKEMLSRNYTKCASLRQRSSPSMSLQFKHFAYLFFSLLIMFVVCLFVFAGELVWKKNRKYITERHTVEDMERHWLPDRQEYGSYMKERHVFNPVFYSLQVLSAFGLNDSEEQYMKSRAIQWYANHLQIIVKTFTCELFVVRVDPNDDIRSLKEKIKDRSCIPTDLQRLVFDGKVLSDKNNFSSYNIPNNSTIYCNIELLKSHSF